MGWWEKRRGTDSKSNRREEKRREEKRREEKRSKQRDDEANEK